MVSVSAFVIALWPNRLVVFAALVRQGLTGGFLWSATAAISLGLVGHSALAERLGRNQRFASAGVLTTTGVMGAIGYFLSYQAIFLLRSRFRCFWPYPASVRQKSISAALADNLITTHPHHPGEQGA